MANPIHEAFDEVHKIANSMVRGVDPIQIPFVNYTQAGDNIVLAVVPGPCPIGFEAKLKSLIDRNIGFKCTVRESDAALLVATYVIESPRDAAGCAINNSEFVVPDCDSLEKGLERLIDETTASIKLH